MSEAFYVLFATTVLSLTGWLDDLFSRLHIGKTIFTILSAVCLILFSCKVSIYGIEMSLASFLLFIVPIMLSAVKKKPEPFLWLAVSSVMMIFLYALLYVFGGLDITIAMIALSLICALLPLPCVFLLSVCTAVPYFAYLFSLFGDFFFYMTNNAPACESAFLAQVVSAVTVLFVSYAKSAVLTYKKQTIKQ